MGESLVADKRGSASAEGADAAPVERMARSGGLSVVGAGVSAVAGVALTGVITNGLDQGAAGTIFATTSLFLIATAVVQLGTDVGLVRWLPALLVTGKRRHIWAVMKVAVGPVLVVSTLTALAGVLLAPRIAHLVGAEGGVSATQVRILAALLPVAALYNVLLAASRGLRTMVPTVVVESVGRSSVQLLAVAAVQALGLGAVAVICAWSLPYLLALVAAAVWFTTLLRRPARSARPPDSTPDSTPGSTRRDFWRFTAPRAVGTTSQILLKRSDIVLVAALRSPREAALYAAASRFVVVGQLGVQALQQALSPQLSALFTKNDYVAATAVYRATTSWAMLLAWPVYLTCIALAPQLLALFGTGYGSVAPVAVLLSVAMLVATACGAVDAVLLMSGHTWLSLGNNLLALALNVGLNLVLIPSHGALGAGIAWTVSILVRNVLPLAQVSAKYHISPVGRETLAVGGCAVACFGMVPITVRVLSSSTRLTVGCLVVGALVYLLLVWRLRASLQLSAFRSVLRTRRRKGRVAP